MQMMHPFAVLHYLLIPLFAATAAATTSQSQALQLPPAAAGRHATGDGAACIASERDALLAFKQGITGDPAGRLASWHEGDEDCCRWSGVRCSNRNGHVIGLRLGNDMYTDDPHPRLLPDDTALSGQISPSLLSLHHLQSLDLSLNNLSGPAGRVPEFLGNFSNLRYLNLSGMPLVGRVPPQLGNLSNLHYLDLSPSRDVVAWLFPELYSTDISWLSNLPLMYLDMGSVILNGAVDWAHVVNMIPSLKVLRLPSCSLTSANQSLPHLNLTHLVELSLSGNPFDHPVASCWLWNLTSLKYLELADTDLYGQIPDALGGMMSLQSLGLGGCNHGSISIVLGGCNYGSIDIMTANMTNLCKLERIDFTEGDFDGSITDLFERLPQCSSNKLKELDLGSNNFSGVLPNHIGRWARLVTLDLSNNQITGQLPSEISMLSNLVTLCLGANHFTGPLPSEIGMLRNLDTLFLAYNGFTGPLPSGIGMLSYLTRMDLSYNNFSGVITHEHLDGLSRLKILDLSRNSLKIEVDPEWLPTFKLYDASFQSCHLGPSFPSWLQSQTNIDKLDISGASIFDSLPNWFSTTFSKAQELYISNNGVNGTLPTTIENMTSLVTLHLDSNQLTGQIPQLPTNLYALDISRNYLSGPLPSNFGAPQLSDLFLSSNHFSGHIPHSICELNLYNLNLADNHLEGEFPECSEPRMTLTLILSNNMLSGKLDMILETYTGLQILDLAWNKFTGSIPETITNLGDLFHLNLAGNNLSGALPHNLSNFMGMKANHRQSGKTGIVQKINMSVTTKGQERYYFNFVLYDMVSIDLSTNHLTGVIPEEITSLDGVVNLNLSRNNLIGNISERIGVMESLESLDLSENKLCGEIPQSLSNLSYLSCMDLSHNNLTGGIPSGGQLDTLYTQDPLMYDGNIGLCGYPLQKNCTTNNQEPKHGDQKRDEHVVLTFSFGVGIGYVVGLWMVFCLILFNKTWRIAYFCLFDRVFDKVYVYVVVTWASCHTLVQFVKLRKLQPHI